MKLEQVTYHYSMKNIPIPTQKEYLLELIFSIEKLIRTMRFIMDIFLFPEKYRSKNENFGFKSAKKAPEMKPFEEDLYDLANNVKFKLCCAWLVISYVVML